MNAGGGWTNTLNGLSLVPSGPMGGNQYDPKMWSGWAYLAAGIQMGSWLGGPVIGLAVNWAGGSYTRSMDDGGNVFFGGLGDATGITSIYNGYQQGSWSQAGLGVLQVGLTAFSFAKPLGLLQGRLPTGGPTMGQMGRATGRSIANTFAALNNFDPLGQMLMPGAVQPGGSIGWGRGLLGTQFAKDVRAYLRTVEAHTNFSLHPAQRQMLADQLRMTSYTRLASGKVHRRAFTASVRDTQIAEWERQTGRVWPTYIDDVKKIRRYDTEICWESVRCSPSD